MRYNKEKKGSVGVRMNKFAKVGWILLCSLVCLAVGVAILAVVPAWKGMGEMSALEAVFYLLSQGNSTP